MLHYYNQNIRSFLISKILISDRNEVPKLELLILKVEMLINKNFLDIHFFWIIFILTGQKPMVYHSGALSKRGLFFVTLGEKKAYHFLNLIVKLVCIELGPKRFLFFNKTTSTTALGHLGLFRFEKFELYRNAEQSQLIYDLKFQISFFFKSCFLQSNVLLLQTLQIPIILLK